MKALFFQPIVVVEKEKFPVYYHVNISNEIQKRGKEANVPQKQYIEVPLTLQSEEEGEGDRKWGCTTQRQRMKRCDVLQDAYTCGNSSISSSPIPISMLLLAANHIFAQPPRTKHYIKATQTPLVKHI